jgi:hypothetical protein
MHRVRLTRNIMANLSVCDSRRIRAKACRRRTITSVCRYLSFTRVAISSLPHYSTPSPQYVCPVHISYLPTLSSHELSHLLLCHLRLRRLSAVRAGVPLPNYFYLLVACSFLTLCCLRSPLNILYSNNLFLVSYNNTHHTSKMAAKKKQLVPKATTAAPLRPNSPRITKPKATNTAEGGVRRSSRLIEKASVEPCRRYKDGLLNLERTPSHLVHM